MSFSTVDSFRHDSWASCPSEGWVVLPRGAHVLIDMDNTGADFNAKLERLWRRHYPHIPKPNFSALNHMKVQETLPNQGQAAQIKRLFLQPGFFRSLLPTPGFVEAVEGMREYFEVSFCTAPMIGHDCPCASEKLSWIREYFGSWGEERCIIAYDKTMVQGDVLIDDNPIIEGKRPPSWKHIYYHQPCNRPEALDTQKIPPSQRAVARLVRWADWPNVLRVSDELTP